jgi:predicted dehydrogenase
MAPPPIRVGLFGYGLAGRVFHAPLINACSGLSLAAVVTGDSSRGKDVSAHYPETTVFNESAKFWARADEFDVVVIATPNRTHVPLALEAVARGLAVVIDKPFALDVASAEQLVASAKHVGVLCTVFHNRRYDADFLTLSDLVMDGSVGKVVRLESRFERWQPTVGAGWRELGDPREGGGILFDLGSHLIDQALVLFGAASTVYCEMEARRPGSVVDDETFVSILHKTGVRSHLFMSKLAARPGPRFHLFGDAASWTKTGLDVQEQDLANGKLPGDPGFGQEPVEQWGVLGTDALSRTTGPTEGSYLRFYDQLVTAIQTDAPAPVDPLDAVAVIEIIDAAHRSAHSGFSVTINSA